MNKIKFNAHEVRTVATLITPELAAKFLERNKVNRPVRPLRVLLLAENIRNGEWITTHQGIAFDRNGNLIDGQHRLLAMIQSGVPCMTFVTTGCDPKSYSVIDIGSKRTFSDSLRIEKYELQPSSLFARILSSNKTVSPQMVKKVHDNIGPTVRRLLQNNGTVSKIFSTAPVKLAAVIRIIQNDTHFGYIHTTYNRLNNSNLHDLSKIASTFAGQVLAGKVSARAVEDLFSRAYLVFDLKRADASKLQIGDTSRYLKEAVNTYYDRFSREPWMIEDRR